MELRVVSARLLTSSGRAELSRMAVVWSGLRVAENDRRINVELGFGRGNRWASASARQGEASRERLRRAENSRFRYGLNETRPLRLVPRRKPPPRFCFWR